jgi:hypothetical protein
MGVRRALNVCNRNGRDYGLSDPPNLAPGTKRRKLMSANLPPSIRVRRLAGLVHDLGPYALYQFSLEAIAKSSGVFDIMERYAKLDAAITNAYGVECPLWPVK